MADTRQLLADYTGKRSEEAFRELVERYLNLVYSTARRLVGGDTYLAEDVVQIVFTDLARKARGLSPEVMLGGWLHQRTFHVATTLVRAQRRRNERERRAAEMNLLQTPSDRGFAQIAPFLDEAILQLKPDDRQAILLRFFEQREFRAVGEAMGTNEDAARMRVNRALEKLHALLTRRGVALSAAALGTVLTTDAVTAAPVGMVASISSSALAAATAGTGTVLALLKTLLTTKTAAIGAVAVAAAAAPLIIQSRTQASLRSENQSLLAQIDGLKTEQQRLANAAEQVAGAQSLSDSELRELQSLRSEAARLRADSNQLAQLKAAALKGDPDYRAALLKQRLDAAPDKKIPELQLLHDEDWLAVVRMPIKLETEEDFRKAFAHLRAVAKQKFGTAVVKALHKYAQANYGQLPSDLSQLMPYFDAPVNDGMLERYELKRTGKLSDVPQLGPYGSPGRETAGSIRTEPVAVEKAPVDDKFDSLLSIEAYGLSTADVGSKMGRGSVSWRVKPGPGGTLELDIPAPIKRTNLIAPEIATNGLPPQPVDPTGVWTWNEFRGGGGSFGSAGGFGGGGRSVKVTLQLKSDGGKLTGTLTEPGSGNSGPTESAISNGELEGNRISFTATEGGRYGSPSTINYHGVIAGDRIIGTEGDYLNWDATRVKSATSGGAGGFPK